MSASDELARVQQEMRDAQVEIDGFLRLVPQVVGEEYVTETQRAIDDKRSPDGKKHADLAPRSRYPRKKNRNPLNHVLIDTGGMRNNAKFEAQPGKVEIYYDYRDKRGKQPQVYHQEGDGLPQRQVLTTSNTAGKLITRRLKAAAQSLSNEIARVFAGLFADHMNFGQ